MRAAADVIVVGGGIVGLASAREILEQRPGVRLTLLEKEPRLAAHQTGHNSGVIHTGVYYRPGSLKARLCVEGRRQLLAYAEERSIPHRLVGKVIVATRPRQLAGLEELQRRGLANGVSGLRRLDPQALRAVEPEVQGLAALHVPGSGIIDYAEVARSLAGDIRAAGGTIRTSSEVVTLTAGPERIVVGLRTGEELAASYLLTCAGLHSDQLARRSGTPASSQIIPFRGEYFRLRAGARSLVRGLVYPVPDPRLPFVDVHLTPTIHGEVEAGPNAVLAFAREGYHRGIWSPSEAGAMLVFPGFWRMAWHFGALGIREAWRSIDRATFARDLARMVPAIREEDLEPGGSGVRAQAVGPDGTLRDDFLFSQSPRSLHVLNAPSPAATSSLALAAEIVGRLPEF